MHVCYRRITRILSLLALTAIASLSVSAKPLEYYLPENKTYLPGIATPEAFIGHQVGEFHARHDRILAYMEYIAETSDRAMLINMGYTMERRPQVLLVISSPDNIQALDQKIAAGEKFNNDNEAPLVVWLGYSIHGNEPSGANTSLVSAYHFSALQEEAHDKVLEDTLIIIEPTMNPDGYGRFSTWVNNNRSMNMTSDPNDREHREDWPNGRTNHYRFDLNRDWLLVTQQNTKNRLKWFHYFHPNVFGDFHEMGTNATYFFQPGVPSRTNPLTPRENVNITSDIARYHARALDAIGSLYYTKQNFDDFYYGKGSTYPDIQGSVGILFEQASARGHLQESINGRVSFPFAVRNQFVTSLSTIKGAHEKKSRIKDYREQFYQKAVTDAANDSGRGIVITSKGDDARLMNLVGTLLAHQIKVYRLAETVKANGKTFSSGVVIPFQQRQYWLIKAMFETRTQFVDNTFYDVSTWNFGHAYNLAYETVERRRWKDRLLGEEITSVDLTPGSVSAKSNVGYVLDWRDFNTPRVVQALLTDGIQVRVARKPFNLDTAEGAQNFVAGSIVVPVGLQKQTADDLYDLLQEQAVKHGLEITAVTNGLANSGIDMGSPDMRPVVKPRPLMLTGPGISAYDSGQLWFFLDKYLDMPITQAKMREFGRLNLNRYTHLLMVQGNYSQLDEEAQEKIKAWVNNGGVLVGMKSANKWLSDNKYLSAEVSQTTSKLEEDRDWRVYDDMAMDNAQRHIGGSIFSIAVDQPHPLAFGINSDSLSVFKNHRYVIQPSKNPYHTVMRYKDKPLVSGFISAGNLEAVAETVALSAERSGNGSVIAISDNPVFRGYWLGSSRLLVNSLFFGTAFNRPNQ